MKVTLISAEIRYQEPFEDDDGYQTEWINIPVDDLNRDICDLIKETLKDDSYDDAIEFCFKVDAEPENEYWLQIDGLDRWWSVLKPNDEMNLEVDGNELPAKQRFIEPTNHSLAEVVKGYGADLIRYVTEKQQLSQSQAG